MRELLNPRKAGIERLSVNAEPICRAGRAAILFEVHAKRLQQPRLTLAVALDQRGEQRLCRLTRLLAVIRQKRRDLEAIFETNDSAFAESRDCLLYTSRCV